MQVKVIKKNTRRVHSLWEIARLPNKLSPIQNVNSAFRILYLLGNNLFD